MLTTEIQQDTHSGPVTLNPRWLRIPGAVRYSGISRARLYELIVDGSTHLRCSCGSYTFPQGNLLPKTPDEWAFVVKRVSRGIRDAQAKYEERIKRLMVSDIVFKYRNSRPERPSILSQVGDSE
jgi:predicted DNA-binding transcriptional regulator AlpA